ncbi:MAG: hypothetical protein ACRCWQ_12485 [Bacilli bacterium]
MNKCVAEVTKQNPSHISVEGLFVKGMMKNRHLSKVVAQQKFNAYRVKLTTKCLAYNNELRVVNCFYPASKLYASCSTPKAIRYRIQLLQLQYRGR